MKKVNVVYRLSDNGYANKIKLANATKMHCLMNARKAFGDNMYVYVDETNLKSDTRAFVEKISSADPSMFVEYYIGGSSAQSFRFVYQKALDNDKIDDGDIVYFLEDDYLHLSSAHQLILEGIEIAHYVSLYDHPDKYIPAEQGGNPQIGIDGGEITKVFRTAHSHWKFTNSTTMTFAALKEQLRVDKETWWKYTEGSYPFDMACFLDLRLQGKSLITPLPGVSTHAEVAWLSPGVDWSKV